MQSEHFIHVVERIARDVNAQELFLVTEQVLPGGSAVHDSTLFNRTKERFQELIFAAQARFFSLNSQPETKEVLQALGVSDVFDPQNISKLIFAFQSSNDCASLFKSYHQMLTLVRFNSALGNLLRIEASLRKFVSAPRLGKRDKSTGVLRFEVLDLNQDGFGFARLEEILPSLHTLFSEFCRVYDVEESNVRIAYMDSGSDLTIGIKSDLKVVDSIKRLFIAVWDKVRFRKIDDFKEKLEAIDGSLDVLAKINEKEKSGVIDPGEATRLKHVIVKEAIHLLQTGTNLQELQSADVTLNNETLLIQMVTPKFLTETRLHKVTSTGMRLPPHNDRRWCQPAIC